MWNLLKRGRSIVTALVMVGVVLMLPACSGQRPKGKVSGTVTYKGKAVTVGDVTFHDKRRGVAATAILDTIGAFAFPALEYGNYTAMVNPPEGEPQDPRVRPTATARVNLPYKTRSITSSNLSFEVKEKSHEFTVVLTD